MADENITIANITPATFEKFILSQTLGGTTLDFSNEAALVTGPTQNWKIHPASVNDSSIVEYQPPYVRRLPEENAMILDMVDSNMKPVLIEFQDGARLDSLKLTPNPDTLSISSSKLVNRYNTMTRWVEEHWGDDLDSVSFSGSTYSFNMAFNSNQYTGLTSVYRNESEAYKFIKSLVDIYRTNGYLYQECNAYSMTNSPANESEAYDYAMVNRFLLQNPSFINNHPRHGMIRERLYNRISFDYVTLLGYFESFDVIEDATVPFRIMYNTIFKSEKTIWTVDA
jgi:hypothetical protein